MTREPWSSDNGRTGQRIASLDPAEFHQAIAAAAIDAIRSGVPAELIDGHLIHHTGSLLTSRRQPVNDRAKQLEDDIADLSRQIDNARRNASNESDPELADEYRNDARRLTERRREFRTTLEQHNATADSEVKLTDFESGADYIAHGLARLATITDKADGDISTALSQIINFTHATTNPDDKTLTVGFTIDVPADGRVARLGPITCTVRNRAYTATLQHTTDSDRRRLGIRLLQRAAAQGRTRSLSTNNIGDLQQLLVSDGWSPLAAGTLLRSNIPELFDIAIHHITGDPPPNGLDRKYVAHILDTYLTPDFAWNGRYHTVDSSSRQTLINIVQDAGGHITHEEFVPQARTALGVTEAEIHALLRSRTVGNAPPWHPVLNKTGDWSKRAPRTQRFLELIPCPHCNTSLTLAIRTPETPDGLICAHCRRIPRPDSPIFPTSYTN